MVYTKMWKFEWVLISVILICHNYARQLSFVPSWKPNGFCLHEFNNNQMGLTTGTLSTCADIDVILRYFCGNAPFFKSHQEDSCVFYLDHAQITKTYSISQNVAVNEITFTSESATNVVLSNSFLSVTSYQGSININNISFSSNGNGDTAFSVIDIVSDDAELDINIKDCQFSDINAVNGSIINIPNNDIVNNYKKSMTISFNSCKIEQNEAENGGLLYIERNNVYVSIKNVIISNNSVSSPGSGGIIYWICQIKTDKDDNDLCGDLLIFNSIFEQFDNNLFTIDLSKDPSNVHFNLDIDSSHFENINGIIFNFNHNDDELGPSPHRILQQNAFINIRNSLFKDNGHKKGIVLEYLPAFGIESGINTYLQNGTVFTINSMSVPKIEIADSSFIDNRGRNGAIFYWYCSRRVWMKDNYCGSIALQNNIFDGNQIDQENNRVGLVRHGSLIHAQIHKNMELDLYIKDCKIIGHEGNSIYLQRSTAQIPGYTPNIANISNNGKPPFPFSTLPHSNNGNPSLPFSTLPRSNNGNPSFPFSTLPNSNNGNPSFPFSTLPHSNNGNPSFPFSTLPGSNNGNASLPFSNISLPHLIATQWLYIDGCYFIKNRDIQSTNDESWIGAIITISGLEMVYTYISDSTFYGNQGADGSAIFWADYAPIINITDSNFTTNGAIRSGLFHIKKEEYGLIEIYDTIFENNGWYRSGFKDDIGAMKYGWPGDVSIMSTGDHVNISLDIIRCSFIENHHSSFGCFDLYESDLYIDDSTFDGNYGKFDAVVIMRLREGGNISITNSIFKHNVDYKSSFLIRDNNAERGMFNIGKANIVANNVLFTNNIIVKNGIFYSEEIGSVILSNNKYINNDVPFIVNGEEYSVNVINCKFINNNVESILMKAKEINVTNSKCINNNHALCHMMEAHDILYKHSVFKTNSEQTNSAKISSLFMIDNDQNNPSYSTNYHVININYFLIFMFVMLLTIITACLSCLYCGNSHQYKPVSIDSDSEEISV